MSAKKSLFSGFTQLLSEAPFVTTLVRYNGDDNKKIIVVTTIKRWLQHHGITWQTDNNVRYYSVQHSADGGISFQPVAKVYNNHQLTLTYEDGGVNAGANDCYRIASIAKDGSRSYSNNVFLNTAAEVKIFPNPARDYVTVKGLASGETANIAIKDGSGNVLARGVSAGSEQYRLQLGSNMQPGTYYLNITTGSQTEVLKLVKE